MKCYRMINVETNGCVASGNIASIIEDFKARNYPREIQIIDEDSKVIIAANEDYNNTFKKVEELAYKLCKRCHKCGRVLPKESFNKKTSSKDGLQDNCKDCMRAYNKARWERVKSEQETRGSIEKPQKLHKVYSNPDLARFTPRELMAELKARGFKWEWMLEPQKKIMFDKI